MWRGRGVRALGVVVAAAMGSAALPAPAQDENPTTPGAIADPSTYQGSMQLQNEQHQQEQQQHQDMQQQGQSWSPDAPAARAAARRGAGAPAVNWWSKPPLPPARNPLLGRWRQAPPRQAAAQGDDPYAAFAAVIGGGLAGGCKSMFGTGVVAFEPTALQWVAPDGHEEILNHVAYRANGAQVIVLSRDPGAIPALIFSFPSRDHAVVATFNCTMDRLGAAPAPSANRTPGQRLVPPPTAPANLAAPPPPSGPANAVLAFQIGVASPSSSTPLAGAHFWVTPEDPAPILSRFGAAQTPLRQLVADCANAGGCVRDFKATTTHTVAVVTSDTAGRAETRPLPLPAGYYYLIGYAPLQGRTVLWTRQVLLQAPRTTVTMDQTDGGVAPLASGASAARPSPSP